MRPATSRACPDGLRLVLDLYDPVLLELLARAGAQPAAGERLHLAAVRLRLLLMLGRADHVLCASELQRAFWLGWLGAAGRLLPSLFEEDPEATRLLAEVPFGIEPGDPVGSVPDTDLAAAWLRTAAGEGEAPLLWWGGLWEWMDPICAIRGVARLRAQGMRVALVLPVGNRPGAAPMPASENRAAL